MGRVGTSLGKRLNGFVNFCANRKGGETRRGIVILTYTCVFPLILLARKCIYHLEWLWKDSRFVWRRPGFEKGWKRNRDLALQDLPFPTVHLSGFHTLDGGDGRSRVDRCEIHRNTRFKRGKKTEIVVKVESGTGALRLQRRLSAGF